MQNFGFSLLELSIVLVIIGLLAGGLMVGQDLIRQSELRAVMNEHQSYLTALNSFRVKYNAVPGDMRNATQYWGRQSNTPDCLTNSSAAVTVNGTCDGNANGVVNDGTAANLSGERKQFWRHLALAGLVSGNFTGLSGPLGWDHAVINVNVPGSAITAGGWTAVGYAAPFPGNGNMYALDYGPSVFIYGAEGSGTETDNPIFRPQEAAQIDTKMDDGKPATGRVIARFWNNFCSAADDGTSTNNDLVASYRLNDSAIRCALNFLNVR